MMKNESIWFDVLVVVLLIVGIFRGRKRGMSQELLSIFQVLIMVVTGSQVTRFLGPMVSNMLSGALPFWACHVVAFIGFILIVHFLFAWVKRAVGSKLVGSDLFGRMEYYMGMLSGMLRYAGCILLFMAILNAKQIDSVSEKKYRDVEKENLGNITFPTYTSIQVDVLEKSFTGKFARVHMEQYLIPPSAGPKSGTSKPKGESIAGEKQKQIDELTGGKSK